MDYRQIYEQGAELLKQAGIEEAALDARLLLEHVCGTTHNTLLAHGDRVVTEQEREDYVNLLKRRGSHEPLAYITGFQEFMGLTFTVGKGVLIPRQDTEILTEEALRFLQDGMEILDLCTGSGCILLSLLHYSNHCIGTGTDSSDQALCLAGGNADRLRLDARFVRSDLFEQVEGRFDIIVSNPPYIPTGDLAALMPEVRDYEPREALDGSADGLAFYRRIVKGAAGHLYEEGRIFLEIGWDQGGAVSDLLRQAGYREVRVVKDYAGLDRVITGMRPAYDGRCGR